MADFHIILFDSTAPLNIRVSLKLYQVGKETVVTTQRYQLETSTAKVALFYLSWVLGVSC